MDFTKEICVFKDQDMQDLWHRSCYEDKLYQELTKLVLNKERNLLIKLQKEKSVSIAEYTLDKRSLLQFRGRI
jgi:hypothetical protein